MASSLKPPSDGRPCESIVTDTRAHQSHEWVGQVISNKYRIESVIGSGSMGVVFLATHMELDERVAIKTIRLEIQKLPGVIACFAREAKATARLSSEHIARIMDVGVSPPVGPYIVMEYMEGRNLYELVTKKGPLELRRAISYTLQALEALSVAHSSGIIHRDIKPDNLFLTRQGVHDVIKLIDFGVSKAALTGRVFGDNLQDTEGTGFIGSPLYMSPEQINCSPSIDHRTDIWSIGVVLFELLTGHDAFEADTMELILARIINGKPHALHRFLDDVPPGLQLIIDKCLEKDPDRRFQSVMELALALNPYASSRGQIYVHKIVSNQSPLRESEYPGPPVDAMLLRQLRKTAPEVPPRFRSRKKSRPDYAIWFMAAGALAGVLRYRDRFFPEPVTAVAISRPEVIETAPVDPPRPRVIPSIPVAPEEASVPEMVPEVVQAEEAPPVTKKTPLEPRKNRVQAKPRPIIVRETHTVEEPVVAVPASPPETPKIRLLTDSQEVKLLD